MLGLKVAIVLLINQTYNSVSGYGLGFPNFSLEALKKRLWFASEKTSIFGIVAAMAGSVSKC